MIKEIKIKNIDDLKILSKDISNKLLPGDLVFLKGELGVGKTTLVREISSNYRIEDQVVSPSFSLINIYNCNDFSIAHFDLYRLNSIFELEDIGAEEYLNSKFITFVEWPEHCRDFFPEPDYEIMIDLIEEDDRKIIIKENGT